MVLRFILVFTYHGGLFTSIKTAGAISERARAASLVVGVPTAIGALALVGATYLYTDLFNSVLAVVCFALTIVFFLISWGAARTRNTKLGFLFSSLSVISVTAAYLQVCSLALWFHSLNPEWSLTITMQLTLLTR